jgi:hypothetical protein
MAKDFEKQESLAFITERSSGQHPSTEYSFYRLVFILLREEKSERNNGVVDAKIYSNKEIEPAPTNVEAGSV